MPSDEKDATISSGTLVRARSGDNAAWHRILDIYEDRVFRQVRRSGVRDPDVSELTACVFSDAFEKLHTFSRHSETQSIGKWLSTITFHTIVNNWRQRQRHPGLLGSAVNHLAESNTETHSDVEHDGMIERAALAAAIAELSDEYEADGKSQQWRCFWMHLM